MNGKIFFENFKLEASVGVHEHERAEPQIILINLEIVADIRKAARSDDIDMALDYDEVKRVIEEVVSAQHYNLLETLAAKIYSTLLGKFPFNHLKIAVKKPTVFSDMDAVGVEISTN